MKRSQTSDRVSSIAARRLKITGLEIRMVASIEEANELAADVRSMAASLLRQDEVKGLRGVVRRLFKKEAA